LKAVHPLYIFYVKAAPTPPKAEIRLPLLPKTQRLTKLNPPSKPIKTLNVALYKVFRVSICVQNKMDKMDI